MLFSPRSPSSPISFWTLIWAPISWIVHLRALSYHPFKTFHLFHLSRSPIIIRPLWKLFHLPFGSVPRYNKTILRIPCISHHLQNLLFGPVARYNETILRNLCISHHLFIFHLGWLPITMKSFWEFIAFLTTSKNVTGQVANYNKTTLKNLRIFHLYEKSSCFSSEQVAYYNKIILKNLCIFHHFEKSLYWSPEQVTHYNKATFKKISAFFTILKKSPYFSPL